MRYCEATALQRSHQCMRLKAGGAFRCCLMRKIQFVSISKHFQNRVKQSEQSILTQVYAIRCSGTRRNNDITKVPLGTEINATDIDNIHLLGPRIHKYTHILPAAAGCVIHRRLLVILVTSPVQLDSAHKQRIYCNFQEQVKEQLPHLYACVVQ